MKDRAIAESINFWTNLWFAHQHLEMLRAKRHVMLTCTLQTINFRSNATCIIKACRVKFYSNTYSTNFFALKRELIKNIKLEQCVFHPSFDCSLQMLNKIFKMFVGFHWLAYEKNMENLTVRPKCTSRVTFNLVKDLLREVFALIKLIMIQESVCHASVWHKVISTGLQSRKKRKHGKRLNQVAYYTRL